MPLANDPRDWALDDDGDLDLSTGGPRWVRGLEAVAQAMRIRLQRFKGEWFLDLDEGVPWLEREGITADEALLGQRFNEAKTRAALRTALLDTTDVLELLELAVSFNIATRQLSVTWTARTTFGDTPSDTLEMGASS